MNHKRHHRTPKKSPFTPQSLQRAHVRVTGEYAVKLAASLFIVALPTLLLTGVSVLCAAIAHPPSLPTAWIMAAGLLSLTVWGAVLTSFKRRLLLHWMWTERDADKRVSWLRWLWRPMMLVWVYSLITASVCLLLGFLVRQLNYYATGWIRPRLGEDSHFLFVTGVLFAALGVAALLLGRGVFRYFLNVIGHALGWAAVSFGRGAISSLMRLLNHLAQADHPRS